MPKEKNSYKFANVDLTGKRFGRLVVVGKDTKGRSWWICKCDCGNTVSLRTHRLLDNYRSCGCLEKENKKNLWKHTKTHGKTNTILYSKYCSMKERCYNPNYRYYVRYGGRGIKVCQEWLDSFENFYNWAYENGFDDNKHGYEQTLDRIDVDKNYAPDNCRWVDQKTQCRNQGKTLFIDVNGEKTPLSKFAEDNNVPDYFARRRMNKGETADEIIYAWNMLHNSKETHYNVHDAAKHYNVSECTIHKWVKNGILNGENVCQHLFIKKGQEVIRADDRDENGRFIKGHTYKY